MAVSNLPSVQPITGTVSIANLPATQPISGAVSVSNLPASQTTTFAPATSSTITVVASFKSPLSALLVGPNKARRGLFLFNYSSVALMVAYDATASLTHMTVSVPPQTSWQMPDPVWQGAVSGLRASGDGQVVITELQ